MSKSQKVLTADVDSELWSTIEKLDLERNIRPVNIAQEKANFFSAISSGIKYNPIFSYKMQDNSQEILRLSHIHKIISNCNEPISRSYCALIYSAIEWEEKFLKRDDGFPLWLWGLYGEPSKKVREVADNAIDIQQHDLNECITADELRSYFLAKLDEYGFFGWSVEIADIVAKVNVSSIAKKISIKSDVLFSATEAERLAVHEIGTHVLRYENGKNQTFGIFSHGFSGYLEAEEGLAIYAEFKSGVLSELDYKKYCLRSMASSLANKLDFYDIYMNLVKHTSPEAAFAITLRVKRGLKDTSCLSGYTKDQIYLSGFLKVKELTSTDLQKLFFGKIGFSELEHLNFYELENELIFPSWMS